MPGSASRPNVPVWVDLATSDPEAARTFYGRALGWEIEVADDPQYGGYAMARVGGDDVAGIGPAQPGQPTAWTVYLGTDDAAALTAEVAGHGGTVAVPAFPVGDVGTMAIVQDPSGAFLGLWQPETMAGFSGTGHGHFTWAELNARGFEGVTPFYADVFGWSAHRFPMPDGSVYTRFTAGDAPIAGGLEMHAMVPSAVPSHWSVHFAVDDTDAAYRRAIGAGGAEMLPPTAYPGGRFAILRDPQGGVFAVRSMTSG
ncbi:MAG: VOC family protein [Chloroflexota bacterium]